MLIHIIRHTTPEIAKGICYGQSDLSLASSFEQEKKVIHEKLLDHYDAVYTSPLQRCSLLAKSLNGTLHKTDDRLMEYNFGDWELTPWEELRNAGTQQWMDNFVDQPAPNGDSILTMKKRVDAFFEELFCQKHKNVAIVTHSGVQRLLHARILETPLSKLFRLQLDFGAVLELKRDSKSTLETIKHL